MASSHRPGGYSIGRSGMPVDAWNNPIPEAEWLPEDYLRLKGRPREEAEAEPEPVRSRKRG